VFQVPKRAARGGRSENDHVGASANGYGRVGPKNATVPIVQPCGYESAIPTRPSPTPQARAGKGTAPRQARTNRKKSLRHRKTATEANNCGRQCAFSTTATVNDEPGCSSLHAFTICLVECSALPGTNLFLHSRHSKWSMRPQCGQGVFGGVSTVRSLASRRKRALICKVTGAGQ